MLVTRSWMYCTISDNMKLKALKLTYRCPMRLTKRLPTAPETEFDQSKAFLRRPRPNLTNQKLASSLSLRLVMFVPWSWKCGTIPANAKLKALKRTYRCRIRSITRLFTPPKTKVDQSKCCFTPRKTEVDQ